MELILGIDLGTTYSCAAWVDETGKPQIIKNKEGFLTTPSAVFFRSPSEKEVGEAAKQYAVMYPDRVVSQIKRHMGEEGYTVYMDGDDLRPEEISGYILKKLTEDAVSTLRAEGAIPPDEPKSIAAVITCPAYFGAGERHATRTAGELAGLRMLAEPLNEPTAAAILFGTLQQGDTRNVLVYDLGGGTFDVTIIHVEPGLIDVVCTGGDHHRGGVDWDKRLMELALQKAEAQGLLTADSVYEDPEALQELTLSAEEAKINLSARPRAMLRFTCGGKTARVEVTREEFEAATEDLLQDTLRLTDDMLAQAAAKGYPLSAIDELLLVGGSTGMPQVVQALQQKYGKTPRSFDPAGAVAKGAALFAQKSAEMEKVLPTTPAGRDPKVLGRLGGVQVRNVSSRSYGVNAFDIADDVEKLFIIIPRNATLPAEGHSRFNPRNDNQSASRFDVMESLAAGEVAPLSEGKKLGEAVLELPAGCTRQTVIDVTFTLTEGGLLQLHAIERDGGREVHAQFQVSGGMSQQELAEAGDRISHSTVE